MNFIYKYYTITWLHIDVFHIFFNLITMLMICLTYNDKMSFNVFFSEIFSEKNFLVKVNTSTFTVIKRLKYF